MTGAKLKPNLFIGKLHREKVLHNLPCLILGQDTNPSASATYLGVVFDSSLNFRKRISQTCRACFYHIPDLRRIRKSQSLDFAKQIAVALVSSKLDYCNSIFHNMPEKDITRLQRVQNCLARVVTNSFLNMRNNFSNPKRQPTGISALLVRMKCSRYLRSTNSNRFVVSHIKTHTGSRYFLYIWPSLMRP